MKASRPDPFDLRRLAKAAQVISAPPRAPARPHPIGLGIGSRHRYVTDSGIALLPTRPEGFRRLLDSVAMRVPTLPPQYSDGAWGALLGAPQLVVELSPPDPDKFLAAGQILPSAVGGPALRHLGLAVIARPDSAALTEAHELVATPVAGVAQLVLLTGAQAERSSDAWIVSNWYDSAEETAAALADLHELSGLGAPMSLPRSAVLLSDYDEAWDGEELHPTLKTCAALLGHQLSGYKPSDYLRKALVHIRSTPPDVLLIADSLPARCEPIRAAYITSPKRSGLTYAGADSLTALVAVVRRRLIVASGVNHSLFMISGSSRDPAEIIGHQTQPRLPIIREGRRYYHHGFGLFIECVESNYFYTIDKAGHGLSFAKRYRMRANGLYWDADLDAQGNVIGNKHKGPAGLYISQSELNSA